MRGRSWEGVVHSPSAGRGSQAGEGDLAADAPPDELEFEDPSEPRPLPEAVPASFFPDAGLASADPLPAGSDDADDDDVDDSLPELAPDVRDPARLSLR